MKKKKKNKTNLTEFELFKWGLLLCVAVNTNGPVYVVVPDDEPDGFIADAW